MSDFNLLTISAVQSHIAPVIATCLGADRFAEVKPLYWVDSKDAPVRRVFAYAQLKGGVIAPRWGYSFDFVPHLVAGKMQWHRTEKSAILDAFIDGQSAELNLSYMWGEQGLLDGMTHRLSSAVRQAQDFWQLGAQTTSVYDQVVALSKRPEAGMYTQLPVAAAFCHALSGREEDARRAMAAYIDRGNPREDTVPKLWAALEGALESRLRPQPV
ncbi:hypothetical protein [Variovorax sp. E3]|uniref:hypothetical protein n=1 Tax=Variovorax sp. E3 TaxID=1914993 RepID=UPI0018DD626F|nr:hypothetical protein [Variovorax sp. E3]